MPAFRELVPARAPPQRVEVPHASPAPRADGILAKRHEVYEAAKKQHPERWNGRDTRDWSIDDVVYLNPDRQVEYTDVAVDNSSKQAS